MITNIELLGTEYTVTDISGKIIKNIQVIPYNDILDSCVYKFDETIDTIGSYLEKCISMFSGNELVDPYKVLWYTTTKDEVLLSEILEYAISNGYDKIILEHLED